MKRILCLWVYVSDFQNYKEKLLSQEKFSSSLTGKSISDKEYENVLKVWDKSEMRTKKDYHDLNLKVDVLLSTNVFEEFVQYTT